MKSRFHKNHIYNSYTPPYNEFITINYDIHYEEGFFMPTANEKKCTQKTSTDSANANGGITVDEINSIQDNVRKNRDFFQKKLGIALDRDMARELGVTAPVYSRIKKGEQLPTLDPFLITLHKNKGVFHCTIDDFLFTDLKSDRSHVVL